MEVPIQGINRTLGFQDINGHQAIASRARRDVILIAHSGNRVPISSKDGMTIELRR